MINPVPQTYKSLCCIENFARIFLRAPVVPLDDIKVNEAVKGGG